MPIEASTFCLASASRFVISTMASSRSSSGSTLSGGSLSSISDANFTTTVSANLSPIRCFFSPRAQRKSSGWKMPESRRTKESLKVAGLPSFTRITCSDSRFFPIPCPFLSPSMKSIPRDQRAGASEGNGCKRFSSKNGHSRKTRANCVRTNVLLRRLLSRPDIHKAALRSATNSHGGSSN